RRLALPTRRSSDLAALGVLEVVEAFADAITGVALEKAYRLGVIAKEVAFLAVVQLLQQGDSLVTGGKVHRGGGLVDRLDGVVADVHVMLERSEEHTSELQSREK